MAEQQDTRKQMIAALTKSVHGDLRAYLPDAMAAVAADPEFFGHLISWNARKGEVRDPKIALPIAALLERNQAPALIENALALLADLPLHMFVKAMDFSRDAKAPDRLRRRLVLRYVRNLETNRQNWTRVAVQYRDDLRRLYALYHIAPGGAKGSYEDLALMRHQAKVGKFAVVRDLAKLPAADIAQAMQRHHISFLIARGALGARAKEPDVALALIKAMTANELVTNARALTRLGVKTDPVLRAAFAEAVEKAGAKKSKKGSRATLKTTRAAEAVQASGDVALATKLHALQERQLQQMGGIEGDWLVLGDRSGSMTAEIEITRQVSAILARMVKGRVCVVFFDVSPRFYDVTGQTYEQIKALTALVTAGGSTSIGCGLQYLMERDLQVDGITIVSDGGQNASPDFTTMYAKYVKKYDTEPTVYFYNTTGPRDALSAECARAKVQVETFDISAKKMDFYSLPNLVQTMRVSRHSLIDEIYATPLATLDQVLDQTIGMGVLRGEVAVPA